MACPNVELHFGGCGLAATAKALHSTCSDFSIIERAFETLLAYDGSWSDLVLDDSALFQLNEFVYYYASEIDGRLSIKEWLRANQDKSMLEKFTASDLAFTMLVYENYHPKWVHEITAAREGGMNQGLDEEGADTVVTSRRQTQRKAGRKRKKKTKYSGPPLKYTTTKRKNAYLGTSWTPEALQRLQSLQHFFDGLKVHDEVWTTCKESFDAFIQNEKDIDGNDCWVPLFVCQDEEDDEGETDVENDKGLFDFTLGDSS